MKIALLTIWHCRNYGAELQAYATIKTLEQLGHEVEIIDVRLDDAIPSNIKGKISNFISSFGPSEKKFQNFWKKYFHPTQHYRTLQDIQENPPVADAYLVGADQVWNPDITKSYSSLFFLDFGGDNVKRLSYASSFGTSEWCHPAITDKIQSLLKRFDAIACREQSGVEILRDVFKIKADCVLDPTFLLENYDELTGKIEEKQTLVFYPLSIDPELETYASQLGKKLGLRVINNKQCTYILPKVVWDRVSVEDWVKNIAEAQFVITRSFHGMVFSLMHRRQFAVVGTRTNRSTRLLNLLASLDLEDRFFTSFDELNQAEPWAHKINYDLVTPKLQSLIADSRCTLNKILSI